MATKMQQAGQLWSIVLATGESAGVDPFVCRWLGRPLPKEYCAFVGGRSMFQHALDRAVQITPPERLIAVVAKEHRQEAFEQLDRRTIGALLLHSIRQGTVASLFLSLTYVQERDPDATVVVFPSDHFVYPEERYLGQVKRALSLAESHPDRLLMLGAPPDRLELEYGWIQPGPRLSETPDEDLKSVQSIVEQPSAVQADSLLQAGGLWNTKAFVGKVRTLWNLGWTCIPHYMPLFERLGQAIGCPNEALERDTIFRKVPALNFFELLRQVPERLAILELTGVLWSEWKKPAHIAETLRRIDRRPAFPMTCLDRPFVPLARPTVENRPDLMVAHSIPTDIHDIAEQALQRVRTKGFPLSPRTAKGVTAGVGPPGSAAVDLEARL